MTWTPTPAIGPGNCVESLLITSCEPTILTFLSIVANYTGGSLDNKYKNLRNEKQNRFDYIIVGAGSAGCVVANRLTENKNWKVLLLEAGDEEPLVAEAPGMLPFIQGSSIDYDYKVDGITPTTCKDYPNACRIGRGKTMGGSSTINYMLYVRGSRHDYDRWARDGNTGWSWKDVLPYFKKSENLSQMVPNGNPDDHGTDGPLKVEIRKSTDDEQMFLDAWKELGYKENDYNSGDQIGTSLVQFTIKDGVRQSTNRAFIRPIRGKRSNLTVRTNSQVMKIIINRMTKKAIGVEYIYNGVKKTVYAEKEVIVSAGSFASPKLLMVSGIGPTRELRKHGIRVIKDLPVGRNLRDHIAIPAFAIITNISAPTFFDPLEDKVSDVKQWIKSRDGPFKDVGVLSSVTFIQSALETRPGYADVEVSVLQSFIDVDQSIYLGSPYYNSLLVAPFFIAPRSRGWVSLNKTDPIGSLPELNFNFFDNRDDLKAIIDGAKQCGRLAETAAFKKRGYETLKVPVPKCVEYLSDDDKYYECIATHYYFVGHHPVGTCKMGPKTDPEAVVDSRLRVRGFKGLRIIDASIIPRSIRGNINAVVIMIAEKASDIIKEDNKQ